LSDVDVPNESDVIPGTKAYAPPELLYGSPAGDFVRRRFGCDAYLLGSMAVYLFTGLSATAFLLAETAEIHRPAQWNDGFSAVLPYLKSAFGRVQEKLNSTIAVRAVKDDLLQMITQLCEPDPEHRGHALNRPYRERQYSLERYVSRTDLMSRRLDYLVVKGL
jgi:serine/threonine protein kinase